MSAVINIGDLINLAVGSRNAADINFKVLQTTLQAIVQHLNIHDMKVEFRGPDSDQIQKVVSDVKDEQIRNIPLTIIPEPEIADKRESSTQEDTANASASETVKKRRQTDSIDDIIVVEAGKVQEPSKRRVVTQAYLARLEAKIKALQSQLETLQTQVMPSDEALLQAARSQQESKPISDLWNSLNITKRMSGAEEGIDRLASLLETVAKEYADLKIVIDRLESELGQDMVQTMKQIKLAADYAKQIRPREELYSNQFKKAKTKAGELKLDPEQLAKSLSKKTAFQEGPQEFAPKVMPDQSNENLPITPVPSPATFSDVNVDSSQEKAQGQYAKASIEPNALFDVIQPIPKGEPVDRSKINALLAQHEYMRKNLEFLTAQVNTLADYADKQVTHLKKHVRRKEKKAKEAEKAGEEPKERASKGAISVTGPLTSTTAPVLEVKVRELENRISKHASKLKRQDVMLAEKTNDYDKRLGVISNTVTNMYDTINTTQSDNRQDSNILEDLIMKIQNIEDAVVEVGCNTQELQEDKDSKNALLEKLAAEIELIKTGKADRFEIEDIFAEKADCYAVLEKVSQDVFDMACNDLAKGIDEALNRVSAQESLLAATMLELQNAIDNKFDRDDVEPLRQEFLEKIESVRKQLHKLAAMKEGRLAAAAKKKYMTDVNCISCDRNVSMKIENDVPCIPALADLPAMHSIGPYITYELDHLRKMKAKQPGPGSLIKFEDLARRYNIKNLDSFENLIDVPNLQTRYCGGSNTKLGPQQRVTHIGHFNIVKGLQNK